MTFATRLVRLLLFAILAVGGAAACSGGQAKPETVLKPIEERRARRVIEEAIRKSGMTPRAPRVIKLSSGADLSEDIGIDPGPYGVAYISSIEANKLGASIPQRDPKGEQLRLVQGSGGAIVLVVWELNYRYDAGDQHRRPVSRRDQDEHPADDGDDRPADEDDEPRDDDELIDDEERDASEHDRSAAKRAVRRRRRRRQRRKPARSRRERPDDTPKPKPPARTPSAGELPLAQSRQLALGATTTAVGIAVVAMADSDIGAVVIVVGLPLLAWAIHRFGRLGVESP